MELEETASVVAQQRQLRKILASRDPLMTKVQRVMRLGFGEEVAEDLVERYQLGQQPLAYYERLTGRVDLDG